MSTTFTATVPPPRGICPGLGAGGVADDDEEIEIAIGPSVSSRPRAEQDDPPNAGTVAGADRLRQSPSRPEVFSVRAFRLAQEPSGWVDRRPSSVSGS